jgi:hypothetical protein
MVPLPLSPPTKPQLHDDAAVIDRVDNPALLKIYRKVQTTSIPSSTSVPTSRKQA